MLESGEILQKRYRIEKRIGQGGMGSVYLATDERFNNTVAIKETLFTDDNYLKAFSREARLLNSLKHTALPKVSDHFIDNNGQYIVMEYIAGEDLFEMIEQSGEAFPLADVKIWGNQLLDALEYLHGQANPIIHRDIKPQNLKLTPEGQVILLDFGLAKGNPTDANHQTAANSIFGYSRNYASLEQIQGTGTDPRSDIYSLAATMYHLLTGKPPADALTRVMMVLNEEKDPLQPSHLIHEQVPKELSNALQEAMSLNANLRPQSAVEMRELLSGKRKSQTVSTKPNTVPNKAVGTNLYTQNTEVFPDGESPELVSKQDGIKTEVLGVGAINSDSIKTKIAKPITLNDEDKNTQNVGVVTQSNPKRTGLFAASSLGVLLLVGTVASMVYMFNQEPAEMKNETSVGFDSNSGTAPPAVDTNNITESDANLEDQSDIFADSDPNAGEMPADDEELPEPNVETPTVTTRAEVQPKQETPLKESVKPDRKKNKAFKSRDGKVIIKNGQIKTESATIKNGRIETKELIVDENGVKFKKPSKPVVTMPKGLGITPEQFEKLSPAQKRRIQNAIDKQKRGKAKRDKDIEKRLERQRLLRKGKRQPPPRPRP